MCRALGAYREAIGRAREAGGFWKSVPPKILEWRGVLVSATSRLHEFLSMDDDERGVAIRRVEGHVTWVQDFKAAYKACMDGDVALDAAVFAEFGFTLGDKHGNVCKSCKQEARGGLARCCDAYSKPNRTKKYVISNMAIGAHPTTL